MELNGEQLIRAPRQRVWDALDDPRILAKCIPGCEEILTVSDSEKDLRLMARIGPVRARFSGRMVMSDIIAPTSCTLAFEGNAGAAGTANGQSRVTLESDGESTRLQYSVNAALGGKLGQVGGRLVEASAKKLADDFFRAFTEQLAPQDIAAKPVEPGSTVALPATAPAVAAKASSSFGTGWEGELQRFFWLALGCGIGFMVARLLN